MEGDTQHFDSLVKSESVANEDEKMLERENGYYTGNTSDPYAYYATEVVEALFEMNVGEVRMIRSEYGYHIVMRYENESGGYALKDNSDFFVSTTGSGYLFMSGLMNQLFTDYLAQYKALVTVDEDALKGVDIKSVGANYHY